MPGELATRPTKHQTILYKKLKIPASFGHTEIGLNSRLYTLQSTRKSTVFVFVDNIVLFASVP